MNVWITLLRGVNVGGHNKLPMAEFRALLSGLGYLDVATYIQSGNAVFRADGTASKVSEQVKAAISGAFGFEPNTMVISPEDLKRAIAANPFPQAEENPTTLHLFFMSGVAEPDAGAMARAATKGEEFHLAGNIFYFHTPNGMGKSDLGGKLARFIKVPMTGRNLRSCHKILELAQGL